MTNLTRTGLITSSSISVLLVLPICISIQVGLYLSSRSICAHLMVLIAVTFQNELATLTDPIHALHCALLLPVSATAATIQKMLVIVLVQQT